LSNFVAVGVSKEPGGAKSGGQARGKAPPVGLLKKPFAYRGCDSCIRKAAKNRGTGSLLKNSLFAFLALFPSTANEQK
jgi:hypothetical protein